MEKEKKKWGLGKKISVTISAVFLALVIIGSLVPKPLLPEKDRQAAFESWHKAVKGASQSGAVEFRVLSEKIAKGNSAEAYTELQGQAWQVLVGARALLIELAGKVPAIPERDDLSKAIEKLSLAASTRESAMESFKKGFETGNLQLITEAGEKGQRSNQYFDDGDKVLRSVAAKYGLK